MSDKCPSCGVEVTYRDGDMLHPKNLGDCLIRYFGEERIKWRGAMRDEIVAAAPEKRWVDKGVDKPMAREFSVGYNKAIDDFIKAAQGVPV